MVKIATVNLLCLLLSWVDLAQQMYLFGLYTQVAEVVQTVTVAQKPSIAA
jgi:hypothetical protein